MNLLKFLGITKTNDSTPIELSTAVREHIFTNVEHWKDIYFGGGAWRYVHKGGLDRGLRRVNSLGAARSVCAELASLCFASQAYLEFKDKYAEKFVTETLQDNGFWKCFPMFLEKVFALGGGVIKTYSEGDKVKLDFVGADMFFPTQFDEKNVYGGIIVSRPERGGKGYCHIERHEKTGDGFAIYNQLFDEDCREINLSELYPNLHKKITVRNIGEPLFVYFRPAFSNNVSGCPLGTSVFANAEDIIKSIDIVFDSLEREFVLGKKRIIVPTSAIQGIYDRDGTLKRYFDTSDEVYQALSANDREELKITDNTSELRVTEHTEALELLLDLLCSQVGLSHGTLSYLNGGNKTAAEILHQGTKTQRTKTSHQQIIREGLLELCRNIALLGKATEDIPLDSAIEDCIPKIIFADSCTEDNTAKIENALKLLEAGIITKEQVMSIYN
jgi:A118 family predicted phage portal protein